MQQGDFEIHDMSFSWIIEPKTERADFLRRNKREFQKYFTNEYCDTCPLMMRRNQTSKAFYAEKK